VYRGRFYASYHRRSDLNEQAIRAVQCRRKALVNASSERQRYTDRLDQPIFYWARRCGAWMEVVSRNRDKKTKILFEFALGQK